MKPSRHVAASAVLSTALLPWLGWESALVFAGGTLLDADRYVWHAIRYRTFRIAEALDRFQGRDRLRGDPRALHSVEFIILLALGCLAWPVLIPFALGAIFHLALDVTIHKSRGRFWFYPDFSHLHFLALEWLRKRNAVPGEPDGEPGSDA